MQIFELTRGTSPVILGFPHTGTFIPDTIARKLNATGTAITDTDWHIHQLYAGLLPGASVIRALFHRYVVDANRDPAGQSLYPGQNTTGLIPLTDFDGLPLWNPGQEPDDQETAQRCQTYHQPYHAAFRAEINRVRAEHGIAIVFDCHSIRSTIPFLFDGTLPDFNIGTNDGVTCDPRIEAAAIETTQAASGYSSALNGRFKGGWTTRHYGQPEANVHAIQLELAQATHLATESAPFAL
ncbi:MAG TPA: N-formylglutamate deformylase, partial [Devosia sp.]|nr:N-formylglutamate deformylase [Devosia sp.]